MASFATDSAEVMTMEQHFADMKITTPCPWQISMSQQDNSNMPVIEGLAKFTDYSNQKKPFCFLDLPPEIRNKIYDLTLISSGPMLLAPRAIHHHMNGIYSTDYSSTRACIVRDPAGSNGIKSFNPSVNFLRTCKAINFEATPLLYGQTYFVPLTGQACIAFLHNIGTSAQYLRKLHITCRMHSIQRSIFKLLMGAKSLQLLTMAASVRRLFMGPINMANALLPVLREIRDGRMGANEANKAIVDIVKFRPEKYEYAEQQAAENLKTEIFADNLRFLLEKAFEVI